MMKGICYSCSLPWDDSRWLFKKLSQFLVLDSMTKRTMFDPLEKVGRRIARNYDLTIQNAYFNFIPRF